MSYRDFNYDDFLKDQFFVDWVKDPDPQSDYFWKNWLDQNPHKKSEVEKAANIIKSIAFDPIYPSQKESNEVLENILNEIDQHDFKKGQNNHYFNLFLQIAAVILFLLGFSLVFRYFSIQPWQDTGAIAMPLIKSTERGQKLSFRLPDGSMIKLNADSRLKISSDFGVTNRNVFLEGEAFFEITRNPDLPFQIEADNTFTQVLGTSFNVKAYPQDSLIKIAVLEGKVKVNMGHQDATLSKDQLLTFHKHISQSSVSEFNPLTEWGWKDNIIFFDEADYPEIKTILERWYNVEITNTEDDFPVIEKFNGTFENESLEEVLEALNYTSKYYYELNDKNVLVQQK